MLSFGQLLYVRCERRVPILCDSKFLFFCYSFGIEVAILLQLTHNNDVYFHDNDNKLRQRKMLQQKNVFDEINLLQELHKSNRITDYIVAVVSNKCNVFHRQTNPISVNILIANAEMDTKSKQMECPRKNVQE